jgi:hypothetical protein
VSGSTVFASFRRALLAVVWLFAAQFVGSFVCGFVLSRLLASSSIMGDLAGAVVGGQVGFAAGTVAVLVVNGRRAGRSGMLLSIVALLVLPVQLALVGFCVNAGLGLRGAVVTVETAALVVLFVLGRVNRR